MTEVPCKLLIIRRCILYSMHAEGLYVISFVMQADVTLPVRELHQVMFAESGREDRGKGFGVSDAESEGENRSHIAEDRREDAPLTPDCSPVSIELFCILICHDKPQAIFPCLCEQLAKGLIGDILKLVNVEEKVFALMGRL